MNSKTFAEQMLLDADVYAAACLIAVNSNRFGQLISSRQIDQSMLAGLASRIKATSAFRSSVGQPDFEKEETFEFILEARSRVIELIGLLLDFAIAESQSDPKAAADLLRWLEQERALLGETVPYRDLPQKYATLHRCGWADESNLRLRRIDELLCLSSQATSHYRPTPEGIQASHLLNGLLACMRRFRSDSELSAFDGRMLVKSRAILRGREGIGFHIRGFIAERSRPFLTIRHTAHLDQGKMLLVPVYCCSRIDESGKTAIQVDG